MDEFYREYGMHVPRRHLFGSPILIFAMCFSYYILRKGHKVGDTKDSEQEIKNSSKIKDVSQVLETKSLTKPPDYIKSAQITAQTDSLNQQRNLQALSDAGTGTMIFRKIGIVLILLSICALLVSLPFLSRYYEKRGLLWNLGKMELIISEETVPFEATSEALKGLPPAKEGYKWVYDNYVLYKKQYLPFKWFFVGDMIVLFIGMGMFFLGPKKDS